MQVTRFGPEHTAYYGQTAAMHILRHHSIVYIPEENVLQKAIVRIIKDRNDTEHSLIAIINKNY